MKTSLKTLIAILVSMFLTQAASAQDAEMADTFRSEGKIYVVVAVVLIVLVGFVTYLFLLDRKLTKLERMIDERTQTKQGRKAF